MEKKFNNSNEIYEKPIVEIIEFTIEENIALSGNFGSGAICTEGLEE